MDRPKRYGNDYGPTTDAVIALADQHYIIANNLVRYQVTNGDWADTLARMVLQLAAENVHLKEQALAHWEQCPQSNIAELLQEIEDFCGLKAK